MSQATDEFNQSNNGGPPGTDRVSGRAAVPAQKGPPSESSIGPGQVDPTASLASPVYHAPPPSAAPRYDSPDSDPSGPVRDERPRGGRRRIGKIVALAAAVIAVFAGGAVGYSLLQPTVYGAQAEFILTPRPELSDAAVDRVMLTQTMVMTSDPVLRPVATQARISLPRLRKAVTAEIVGRSNVLRLTVGDRSRARAVTLVQLITRQYIVTATVPPIAEDRTPTITSTLLSSASPVSSPLQPRPLRALAAGVLLGVLVAAAAVVALLRPRFLTRPSRHLE
jgi:capsular polysaccharide biosynthesis protein